MRSIALFVLVLVLPAVAAEEEGKLRRDPAAVAKIEAVEKLAFLPRREALTKVEFVATLTKPGKYAAFDVPLGAFEIWLEEPDSLRVKPRRTSGREAEEILPLHDGKRCVIKDLVDWGLWPFAVYPNAEDMSIAFAPKSRTKVRLLDSSGTGLEVTFGRNGLPKQHSRYENGKRGKFEKLEWGDYGGTWLLDRRTAQGGKDTTRWHWEKKDGLYLPTSIDRTLGKLEFRIDLEYVKVLTRPKGEPPKLPPRSDPAGVAALRRAERLVYDPVAAGARSVRFRIQASDLREKKEGVFLASFTAPKAMEVVLEGSDTVPEALGRARDLIEVCFLKAVFTRTPVFPRLDDDLVTKHPEESMTWVVSDRRFARTRAELFPSGALWRVEHYRTDPVSTQSTHLYYPVDGRSVIEASQDVAQRSKLNWTWAKTDGIWLPTRVLHTISRKVTLALTVTEAKVTKQDTTPPEKHR